jgi:hypothetical protein
MDEISKISNLNVQGHLAKKAQGEKASKEEVTQTKTELSSNQVPAEQILDALTVAGNSNAAQMGLGAKVNPRDYLSEERISDIAKSMSTFDAGVEEHLGVLKDEFATVPEFGQLSEAGQYALAAQSFASVS